MSALMQLLAQKKQALSANRRAKTVKPTDGRSRWRILPGWRGNGDGQFYHDFGQHFIKDSTGELKAVYICVEKTFGKPCAVCSGIEHAIKNTGDDALRELLKESKAAGRVLMNALHVDGQNPGEPQILEVAPSVFEQIVNIVMEWGEESLSLDKGNDIIIERTGKGKNTKYSVQVAAKSAPVDPAVMSKIANLDEYVAQESEELANRALTNVSAVAGLPAPGATTASRPASAPAAAQKPDLNDVGLDDPLPDELYATATPPAQAAAAAAAPAQAAPAAQPAASAPAADFGVDDPDLDKLLAQLG